MTWKAVYADKFGLKRQLRISFKVKIACGRKRSHYLAGYSGSAVQRHVIICALIFWIERSATLHLWMCRGTNWYLMLFLTKLCFIMDDTSLSRI